MRLRTIFMLGVAGLLMAGCREPDADVREGDKPIPGTPVTRRVEPKQEAVSLKEKRSGDWSPGLSDEEKLTLFAIARDTLEWSVRGRKGQFAMGPYALTPKLKGKSATFVTFKNKGRLRGCMGCLEAVEAMYLSVHRSAANAARDFRFADNPIRLEEIPEIDIHVSLLSQREKIASAEGFKLGDHGIWLTKGGRGAVYLPEVAVEQGWTREQTLSSLCQKAGLRPDAWKEGTTFMIFYSVVLSKE